MAQHATTRGKAFLLDSEPLVVAGLGRSGQAAVRLLADHGVSCTVTDSRPRSELAAALDGLPPATRWVPQDQAAADLLQAGLVVVSPGIDTRRQPFAAAAAGGVPLISEIELAWRFVDSPLVAVTGTNGKSTVTALTSALLAGAGLDARVCGNIGVPLSAVLENQGPATRFICEVSSFQLELITSFAPAVAVLLNITPDHQDRYADGAAYAAAKERLFAYQGEDDWALIVVSDAGAAAAAARLEARGGGAPRLLAIADSLAALGEGAGVEDGQLSVRLGGRKHRLAPAREVPLPGPHNRINILSALAAALAAGAPAGGLAASLAAFRPLPHRLEPVGQARGITFVNDSKATNMDSARMALRSYPPGRVVALLGGRDKGSDFTLLADDLRRQARCVVAMGEAGPAIVALLQPLLHPAVPVHLAADLEAAVTAAAAAAQPGDTVLLSPACASFDAYRNFEARGDHFRTLASRWMGTAG